MVIECGNCGAPLDVKSGQRLVKCAYCGISQQLQSTRTLMQHTPRTWTPPPQWTPPPHFRHQSVALPYKAIKTWVQMKLLMTGSIVIVAVIAVIVGSMVQGSDGSGDTPSPRPVQPVPAIPQAPGVGGPVPAICKKAAACCRVAMPGGQACNSIERLTMVQACQSSYDAFKRSAAAQGKSCN